MHPLLYQGSGKSQSSTFTENIDSSDENNYTPISILSVVSRNMEGVDHHEWMICLEDSNLLLEYQFGYC